MKILGILIGGNEQGIKDGGENERKGVETVAVMKVK